MRDIKETDTIQFLRAIRGYCETNGKDPSLFDGFNFRLYQDGDRFEGHFINRLGGHYTIFKLDSDDEMTHEDISFLHHED
jgi:hypothetical protein